MVVGAAVDNRYFGSCPPLVERPGCVRARSFRSIGLSLVGQLPVGAPFPARGHPALAP
jgi:hypothetical protein